MKSACLIVCSSLFHVVIASQQTDILHLSSIARDFLPLAKKDGIVDERDSLNIDDSSISSMERLALTTASEDALYLLGVSNLYKGQEDKALEWFLKAAERDHTHAQIGAGLILYSGSEAKKCKGTVLSGL